TVSCSQVPTREDTAGPSALDRFNRVRVIYIRGNLAYGKYLSEVIEPVTADIEKMNASGVVPAGFNVEFGGSAEQQEKNFAQIKFAFTLAIIFVYMVLASLFESLILPLTVLFTVPSALIGALGSRGSRRPRPRWERPTATDTGTRSTASSSGGPDGNRQSSRQPPRYERTRGWGGARQLNRVGKGELGEHQ